MKIKIILSTDAPRDSVDRARLKRLLRTRGITIARAARECRTSARTLLRKLNGGDDFTVPEIQALYKLLRMTCDEASEIFFGRAA